MFWYASLMLPLFAMGFFLPLDIAHGEIFPNGFLYLDGILCVLFLGDLFLRLNDKLSLPIKSEGNFAPKEIKYQYYDSKFWLFIDCLAVLPFELIAFACNDYVSAIGIYFIRSLNFLKVLRYRNVYPVLSFLPKQIKIALFASVAILAIHWITCGWITLNAIQSADFLTTYNISLYWAITTLTTVGYGDITPQTNIARVYTMIVMLGGVTTFGLVISHFFQLMLHRDQYTKRKKEEMEKLHAFFNYYEIPSNLRSEVHSFYTHLLNKNISEEDKKVLNSLPRTLQEELNTYMKIKLIREVHIFDECTSPCLRMIANRLEQKDFSPDSFVIEEGDIGSEMYIIAHGEVEVFNKQNEVIARLQAGQFFGEIALIEDTIRSANVKTSDYCDLYVLNKQDFLEVTQKYPKLGQKFTSTYKKRASDNQRVKIKKAA